MSSSKLDRDLPLIQQHWNNFKSLVQQDLSELSTEQKKVENEIKKVERIAKIIKFSGSDINFIIAHKEVFIELDPNLSSQFVLLEAFKKRNNLDNDLAILTYNQINNQIKNNDKIIELLNSLEGLKLKSNMIQERIENLNDLFCEDDYSQIDLISELCETHNLGEEARKMLFLYPIIKTLKKPTISKEKVRAVQSIKPKAEVQQENRVSTTNMIILENEEPTMVVAPEINEEQEIPNYQDYYNQQKNEYEKLKENVKELLNKYYVILTEMKPYETQFYRTFCSYTEDEFGKIDKNQFEDGYDEAKAKILAIKLFDAKTEIEKTLISIANANYTDKEEIEYLEEFIGEFQSLSDRLKIVDENLVDNEKQVLSLNQSKVFFLTDRMSEPFIPEEIRKGQYQRSLVNIMKKAQEGLISKKQGCNIKILKTRDAKFKEQVGRTVFVVRNNKIMVSYIKLNSNNEIANDGGIMILTATPLVGGIDGIQKATDKIIKENRERLIRQLALIEKQDPQQLVLQEFAREGLTKGNESLGEGEIDGYKIR